MYAHRDDRDAIASADNSDVFNRDFDRSRVILPF